MTKAKRVSSQARPTPLDVPSVEALQLKTMTILETVRLWRNCLAYLSDGKKHHMHKASRQIKTAIEREWSRRRRLVNGDQYFEWPSTKAQGASGNIDSRHWMPEGMLTFMGYHVGHSSGLGASLRQAILRELFYAELPPVCPNDYLKQFGRPRSSQRLQKVAEVIAALTRNAKRRGRDMTTAIRDWESDLEYLYYNYYIGHFGFGWPSTQAS